MMIERLIYITIIITLVHTWLTHSERECDYPESVDYSTDYDEYEKG